MRLRFDASKAVVGRVVNEDDDFLLLEQLDPETPDRFFTLVFARVIEEDDEKVMETWRPWEAE